MGNDWSRGFGARNMKKLVTGFTLVAVLLSVADLASASDMAVKARPAPKYDPCGVARFSGAYLGGNAGAIGYTALHTDPDKILSDSADYSGNKIGFTAGIQAGYDWQSCNKVFGIVADWNWADTATIARLDSNFPGVNDVSFRSKMDWFSTLRARAGLAVNNTLFYVTGGVAAAEIKSTVTRNAFATNERFSFGGTRWGFAGGAGAEFALWNNWSLNTELLYLQFQKDSDTFRSTAAARNVAFESIDSAWIGRVGLNYRWDNPRIAYAAANVPGAIPVHPCGPARFSGGYVGGNAGGVSYTALRNDQDGFVGDNGDYSSTRAGFTAGAQLGWDWQSCNTLLGIVADWNWTNADTVQRQNPNSATVLDQSIKARMDWFSTIRARAGLAVDDALIYVTGGLAAASIDSTITNRSAGISEQHNFGDTRWGFAGGVGAEFALAGGWSVNTELLYMQFSKTIDTFRSPALARDVSFESQDSIWVSRAGLNYRWDNARNAYAADASAKGMAVSPCGPARFSGGYIGGNVGAIRHTSLGDDQDGFLDDRSQHTGVKGGVTAGGQAGYDWQSCRKVFGVVADWNWTNADTLFQRRPNDPIVVDSSMRSQMDWFSTIRARSGLAVNDVLVYVTGGFAAAKIESKITSIIPVDNQFDQFTSSNTRWGWTGGAGAEVALKGGWSVNGEVLYMQFSKEDETFRSPANGNAAVSFQSYDSAWVGRVGVNYRWGAGGGAASATLK